MVGPAAHSSGAPVQILPSDHAFDLEHVVHLLVNVLGLELADVSVPSIWVSGPGLPARQVCVLLIIKVFVVVGSGGRVLRVVMGPAELVRLLLLILVDSVDLLAELFKLLGLEPDEVLFMLLLHL